VASSRTCSQSGFGPGDAIIEAAPEISPATAKTRIGRSIPSSVGATGGRLLPLVIVVALTDRKGQAVGAVSMTFQAQPYPGDVALAELLPPLRGGVAAVLRDVI
jgi:hypothetical protein